MIPRTFVDGLRKYELLAFLRDRVSESSRTALSTQLFSHDVFTNYDVDWTSGQYRVSYHRGNRLSPTKVLATLNPLRDLTMDYYHESIDDAVENVLFLKRLKAYGLLEMWDHIRLTNSGAQNPYHNNRHMFKMAQLALALYENSDLHPNTVWPRIIVMACLWHDYGHSGGLFPDAVNIDVAVAGFHQWVDDHPGEAGEHISKVERLIRVTEFPFIHHPQTIPEQCVRDADLLYTFSDDTGVIVEGLYQELIPKLPAGTSFLDFTGLQRKFLSEAKFYTPEGQAIYEATWERVLKEQVDYAKSQAATQAS